ncbi:MAG: uracil-DNA glycosylase family protein [Clostridia bacterium]
MENSFNMIKQHIESCRFCQDTFGFEPSPLFWGNENSKIVQISQAPSKSVHESGKPFMDMSGKVLKSLWYQISDEDFYNKDNFYICSMAHCYPGKDKNGKDRQPPIYCFKKWVKEEINYVNNKIYILLGAKAAKAFFPNQNFESLVFKDHYLNGKLTFVLPHPSPLNRRWLKKHPLFLKSRMKDIRNYIHQLI